MNIQKILKMKTGGQWLIGTSQDKLIFCRETFTEEHKEIEKMVFKFVKDKIYPNIKQIDTLDEKLSKSLLKEMGSLGLLGIDTPEIYGGTELDKITACIVAEAVGYGGSASFGCTFGVQTCIGSLGIVFFGTDKQKEKYLPALMTGEKIAAYALTEPSAGSDALSGKTSAILSEDGKNYILNGEKQFISNGGWADIYTILAQVNGTHFSGFIVEKGTKGFTIGPEEKKMGMKGSSTTSLKFTNALVPVENLLSNIGDGPAIAFSALNIGRYKLGASSVGGSKLAVVESIKYAHERKQFGQEIAQFDSIKSKITDSVIRIYLADTMLYRTVGMIQDAIDDLDKKDDDYYLKISEVTERFAVEASMVKVYGSETSNMVVDSCLQIFGGYGFIEEYPMAMPYRDDRINRIWEGTNEINKMLCGRAMITKTLSGELGFREYLDKIDGYCNEGLDSGYEGHYKDEAECIEAAKAVYALALNESLNKYGQDIGTEQVVIENLANILIYCYVADSTLSRVIQNKEFYDSSNQVVPELCAKVYTAEQGIRVMEYANKIFNSIFDSHISADIEQKLDVLKKRLSLKTDTIGLKKIIGEKVVETGAYPVKSF